MSNQYQHDTLRAGLLVAEDYREMMESQIMPGFRMDKDGQIVTRDTGEGS